MPRRTASPPTLASLLGRLPRTVPRLDAELLAAHVLGRSRLFILTRPGHPLTARQAARLDRLFARRANGEPLAYLTGHREFYGRDFIVTRDTLIPRPETELLVAEALRWLDACATVPACVVDVGTGSGNIIVTLASIAQQKKVAWYASDIADAALRVARRNARRHQMHGRIRFLHSDLLEKLQGKIRKHRARPLLIVANLPYLSPALYRTAEQTVRAYEPRRALTSGEHGLAHIRRLLRETAQLIPDRSKDTTLFFEFSPEQALPLALLVKSVFPLGKAVFHRDLAGKQRLCRIDIPPPPTATSRP